MAGARAMLVGSIETGGQLGHSAARWEAKVPSVATSISFWKSKGGGEGACVWGWGFSVDEL